MGNLGDLDIESFFETFVEDDGDIDVDHEITVNSDDDNDDNIDDNYDGSSDSEDEDIEETERRMKEEMVKLQNKDPEFHQFLRENEDTLLDYGDDDIPDDLNDNDDDDTEQSKK